MPNLKQHTDPSGTFGTLGLGTVEAIRIKDTGEVVIPNLPAKLDTDKNIVLGTAVAATGTVIDFTGIPSTAKRVTVMFRSVSTTGASPLLIRLGTSGGLTISGYSGSTADILGVQAVLVSTGFQIGTAVSSGALCDGAIVIENYTGNSWVAQGNVARSDAGQIYVVAGSVALAAVLDRIRITTANGTDTFDAGTINISWE